MCFDRKAIKNKYDNHVYYCDCGHCSPCLQAKANRRVERIQNEFLGGNGNGLVCLFVLLSYANSFVPYIRKSDYEYFREDPDNRCLYLYRSNKTIQVLTKSDFLNYNKYPDFASLDLHNDYITSFRGGFHYVHDVISVRYLKDIQNFFKLLKINLFRQGYEGYFSYFWCSDYGGENKRCHFHILVYCDSSYYKTMVSTICKSWPFADLDKPRRQKDGSYRRSWEIARNPASYVASYVNCVEDVSPLLANAKPFKPLYKFSQGFGCHYKEFSLVSVVEKFYQRNLYYVEKRVVDGSVVDRLNIIPQYVMSRYFPKFKGFAKLYPDEVELLARQPARIFAHARFREEQVNIDDFIPCSCRGLTYLDLDLDLCKKIYVKLLNINRRCYALGESFFYSWSYAYSRVWPMYYSNLLVQSWQDVRYSQDVFEHFDNIDDYLNGYVKCPFFDEFYLSVFRKFRDTNCNHFVRNILKNNRLLVDYSFQKHNHSIKSYYYE